jgi:hypothetical protein
VGGVVTDAEKVAALREALDESNALLRSMGQALMSQFPGEDAAIAQLQMGDSLVEKSIVRRAKSLKLLAAM